MIEQILKLLSKVVDAFRERKNGERQKTIEHQREEIKNLKDEIKCIQATENARLNAERANEALGKHKRGVSE